MDSTIRVYSSADGNLHTTLEGPDSDIEWFSWHGKGHVIVAGSSDTSVWMWNAANGSVMRVFSGHQGAVLCGAFNCTGKLVVTGGEDGSVYVWNPKSGQANHKAISLHDAPINSLACALDSNLVLTGGQDHVMSLYNADSGKVLSSFAEHSDSVESVAFCPTLKLASSGSLDKSIKVWDLSTGTCRLTLKHDDGVICTRWHPSEPLLYSCSLDKTVRLWDARTGEQAAKWGGHQDAVLCMAISGNGSTVVSGSDDKTALVFKR
mmetsp:Transcript_11221/g.21347  ORF Transcript_11221/g.21347 Transcript_11221/m.21347 type:complete len:263 (+) Transcript_11221:691-1479(+)